MPITRTSIRIYSEQLAEEYSEAQLLDMRRQLLAAGGKRITSWSDIGLSASSTYDVDTATMVAILARAIKIKRGLIIPGTPPAPNVAYFS